MNAALGALEVVAALMALATGALVWLAVEARRRAQAWVALYLLAMMGEMWVAAVVYFAAPSTASLVAGIAASGGLMVATAVPLLIALARQPATDSHAAGSAVAGGLSLFQAVLIAGLVLINEVLMSWAIQLALGGPVSVGAPSTTFAAIVDSPWFLFTMGAEMAVSALLLRQRLPRAVLGILLTQSAIMVLSPPALNDPTWIAASTYMSSGLMIGLFVFVFEYLYRYRQFPAALANYLVELVGVYGLMMVGLFVWMYFGDATTFAISILLEMLVFYAAVVRPSGFQERLATPWQLRPHWTFALLSFVFVAELAMGAVLSLQLDPGDYVGAFPFLALSGPPATLVSNAVSNGFWFLATAAASTWFLAMMGLEMGTLVAFKFRASKNLENRIRLGLTMGSYAAFAVFYPSFYFALVFPAAPDSSTVPVLGWSMGIGSYPLAIGTFGVLAATYAITGVLVAMFGRRVVCSVFCTAPLMYQGTALDAMKSFNRSSPVGRKYLSSRFSAAYSITTGAVMTALVGTSVLSYLNTTGATSVYIQGNDPSVFFFVLSFSVAWYVLFVSIPYTGNYNCVTMGWCYTGTITQAFQKIGFFKLKVRDRQVCRDCTTVDCAKGCPVGLVDMPGHFRTTGEFRSTKCCGVGDCVEDCPYDNLYISDVRHWIRRRLGRPETHGRRGPAPAPRGAARPALAVAPSSLFALPDGVVPLPMVMPSSARAQPSVRRPRGTPAVPPA